MTVKSGSTMFSVPQQRAVNAAKEFCVQIHTIKLACKAPANVITLNVSGGNCKDSPSYYVPLERSASTRIMIILNSFFFMK